MYKRQINRNVQKKANNIAAPRHKTVQKPVKSKDINGLEQSYDDEVDGGDDFITHMLTKYGLCSGKRQKVNNSVKAPTVANNRKPPLTRQTMKNQVLGIGCQYASAANSYIQGRSDVGDMPTVLQKSARQRSRQNLESAGSSVNTLLSKMQNSRDSYYSATSKLSQPSSATPNNFVTNTIANTGIASVIAPTNVIVQKNTFGTGKWFGEKFTRFFTKRKVSSHSSLTSTYGAEKAKTSHMHSKTSVADSPSQGNNDSRPVIIESNNSTKQSGLNVRPKNKVDQKSALHVIENEPSSIEFGTSVNNSVQPKKPLVFGIRKADNYDSAKKLPTRILLKKQRKPKKRRSQKHSDLEIDDQLYMYVYSDYGDKSENGKTSKESLTHYYMKVSKGPEYILGQPDRLSRTYPQRRQIAGSVIEKVIFL